MTTLLNAEASGIPKGELLGIPVHDVDVPGLHRFIEHSVKTGGKSIILYLNIHGANLACENRWLKDFYNKASLVFCDGDGIRMGLRILGKKAPEKITYAPWMGQLAQFSAEKRFRLFFLGAAPEIAEAAARNLRLKYPELMIAGTHHGYFDHFGPASDQVIAKINQAKPDILITGFGMPLQEKWILQNWQKIGCPVFLTAGAAFEYAAGYLTRAPQWMLNLHLEWLYRFFQEPGRLFARYFVGNPKFLIRILMEKQFRS